MLWASWLSNLRRRAFGTRTPREAARRERRRRPLGVERLESRVLPAVITVNSLADNTTAGDGLVTLREAIAAANTDGSTDQGETGSGSDQIVFAPDLNGTIALLLGQMDITQSLTLTGHGPANTIIDAQQNSRIFDVKYLCREVTIDNLTLQNGKTTARYQEGGAIRSEASRISITNSVLTGNSTVGEESVGGAISSRGVVTVLSSYFDGNVTEGRASNGGAICAAYWLVSVENSTFVNNSARIATGGAISALDVVIEGSVLTGNSAAGGGAVAASRRVTLHNSTISGNSALNGGGGAIGASESVTVMNSTLNGNSANGRSGYGGAIGSDGAVTLTNSTLSGNIATGRFAFGGAVHSYGFGIVTVTNSTLTGNVATGDYGSGGAIYAQDARIQNSIIAGNSANTTNPDFYGGGPVVITHSLIGNNTDTNLIATTSSTPDANGNFIGSGASPIDPLLGPLGWNGGTTQTHALLAGSLAIDHGDDRLAVAPANANQNENAPLTSDQRGAPFVRRVGTVDMGAYEAQPLFVVDQASDENDGDYSPGDLSLREAVGLANARVGADTITFAATLNGTPLLLDLGQITITDSVTLTGNGPENTIIDAQQRSRIFDVTGRNADVSINGVTLRNGRTVGDSEGGGAIRKGNSFGRTLTINDSLLQNNSTLGDSSGGGAIAWFGALSIRNSTLSGNCTRGSASYGGAVYAWDCVVAGNSNISGNSTSGYGSQGGAISASNEVRITGSTLDQNSTSGDGGAIFALSAIVVKNSQLTDNHADGDGGAIVSPDIAVLDSSLSENSAGARGGAIHSWDELTVTNSTISGNTAGEVGGGTYSMMTTNVTNSTIAANHADGFGGGITNMNRGLNIQNSIIAGNTNDGTNPFTGEPNFSRPDIYSYLMPTIRHSIIGTGIEIGLSPTDGEIPDANGNFIGSASSPLDPMLGPLQDNGGATFTHLPLRGSLAINGGSNELAVDPANGDAPLSTDQRGTGFDRIRHGIVDLGAVETDDEGPSNAAPTDILLSSASVPENSPNGTVVGELSALDPDAGDSLTFSLLDSADGRFGLSGSNLIVTDSSRLDFETNTSHSVTVRVTDSGGNDFQRVFIIEVTDVSETLDQINYRLLNAREVQVITFIGIVRAEYLFNVADVLELGWDAHNVIVEFPDTSDSVTFTDVGGADGRLKLENAGLPDLIVSLANAEWLEVAGRGGDDTFTARGLERTFTGRLAISGDDGNDTINARWQTVDQSLNGGHGDDRITGGSGNDVLTGGQGQDLLRGGSGTDTVTDGVTGRATLTSSRMTGNGSDSLSSIEHAELHGSPQADWIDASGFAGGSVVLIGWDGDDTLIGSRFDDVLFGADGTDQVIVTSATNLMLTDLNAIGADDDTLREIESAVLSITGTAGRIVDASAFSGQVTINGGRGADTILGSAGGGTLNGNAGHDSITGGSSADAISGGAGNDILLGAAGDDTLSGDDGHDILDGGDDDDVISGNRGRDLLIGGLGSDILNGNEDDDLLIAGQITAPITTLNTVRALWTTIAGYNTRKINVAAQLIAGTNVLDFGTPDNVRGHAGRDLFFAKRTDPNKDSLLDKAVDESVI